MKFENGVECVLTCINMETPHSASSQTNNAWWTQDATSHAYIDVYQHAYMQRLDIPCRLITLLQRRFCMWHNIVAGKRVCCKAVLSPLIRWTRAWRQAWSNDGSDWLLVREYHGCEDARTCKTHIHFSAINWDHFYARTYCAHLRARVMSFSLSELRVLWTDIVSAPETVETSRFPSVAACSSHAHQVRHNYQHKCLHYSAVGLQTRPYGTISGLS